VSAAAGEFDLNALHRALDEQREARGLSWSALAREICGRRASPGRCVSSSTIRGLADRGAVEGDGVLQMLLWLDRPPESFVSGLAPSPDQELPSVPGDRTLRFDATAIHAELDRLRRERGQTWAQVAAEIGQPAAGLTRLAAGGRVTFPGVMRIFRWLDQPAARFTRASTW
jgi:hypothetical protein